VTPYVEAANMPILDKVVDMSIREKDQDGQGSGDGSTSIIGQEDMRNNEDQAGQQQRKK
jgi:hypothetical protein